MDLGITVSQSHDSTIPVLLPDTDRVWLAKMFCKMGYKRGVEVGTERGYYAETLCKSNPGLHLYCVDPWHPYTDYIDYQGDFYDEARLRLKPYKARFICKMSMDAVKCFPDESLDFVYIDANHFLPYIADDIREWSKKVRIGGIVSGHDYVTGHSQVIQAVEAYTVEHGIHPVFLVGNVNLISTDDHDGTPSFFWLKE